MRSLALSTLLFATLAVPAARAADEAVRLLDARVVQSCSSCFDLLAHVAVKNLAYDKQVSVVYPHQDWRGVSAWVSAPGRYVGRVSGDDTTMAGWEIWEVWVERDMSFADKFPFAVSYDVLGKSYWDNNCGWNYEMPGVGDDGSGQQRLVRGRTRGC